MILFLFGEPLVSVLWMGHFVTHESALAHFGTLGAVVWLCFLFCGVIGWRDGLKACSKENEEVRAVHVFHALYLVSVLAQLGYTDAGPSAVSAVTSFVGVFGYAVGGGRWNQGDWDGASVVVGLGLVFCSLAQAFLWFI